ncbi:hypothetical protein LXA43DRAFT_1059401 [Ganoderma leucocontextum]|nr:hypothetical protein LXA43DRAFT_1059401 [Ganoderma leucocontextum]
MGGSRSSVTGSDPFDPAAFRGMGRAADEVLPPWLKGAISTLETRNPLRLLLPDDVTEHEDSGHSDIRNTFDIVIASEQEVVPFAFTKHTALSSEFTTRLGNIRASPTTTDFTTNDRPSATNKNLASWGSEVQKQRDHITPLELSFSTPGPASTTSLLASPVLPRPPAYAPRVVPTVSQSGLDEPVSSEFVPFTKPGPCSSTAHTARVPVATGLLHLRQHVASSPVQDATSPVLRRLESPLSILPFSTPGPIPPVKGSITTATDICFVRSPAPSNLTLYTLPSPHEQPQQTSTPDLLYSSPASPKPPTKPNLVSPRSSSVEDFLFILQDGTPAVARPHSPLVPRDQFEPASGNIDYNVLDFKWERFDRGDMVADSALASSPRPPHPGSEETFWSQPARRLPALATPIQRQDDLGLVSSPASLRLTGISTPLPASLSPSRDHSDANKGAPGRQQDSNPFAWIIPPRHAGPPSTPQSKKSSNRRTPRTRAARRTADRERLPGLASEARPAKAGGGPQCQGRRQPGVVDVDASETQGPELHPPERRVPFAPCAGIYISPLQSDSDDRAGEGDMDGTCEEELESGRRRSRLTTESKAGSSGNKLSASSGRMEDVHQRRLEAVSRGPTRCVPSTMAPRRDDRVGAPGFGTGKQGVSQSTINNSTQSGGSPCDVDEDEVEEVEEDELERCSQETRDTIESWTA